MWGWWCGLCLFCLQLCQNDVDDVFVLGVQKIWVGQVVVQYGFYCVLVGQMYCVKFDDCQIQQFWIVFCVKIVCVQVVCYYFVDCCEKLVGVVMYYCYVVDLCVVCYVFDVDKVQKFGMGLYVIKGKVYQFGYGLWWWQILEIGFGFGLLQMVIGLCQVGLIQVLFVVEIMIDYVYIVVCILYDLGNVGFLKVVVQKIVGCGLDQVIGYL